MAFHGSACHRACAGHGGRDGARESRAAHGQLRQTGAGVNPLRGQNNVQGSRTWVVSRAISRVSFRSNRARVLSPSSWGGLSRQPGLNLMEMIDAARKANSRRCGRSATTSPSPIRATPDPRRSSIELVIVQDLFLQRTRAQIRPRHPARGCSPFEKEGTFMNSERRVQRVRKVIEPPGECRTDCELLRCCRGDGPRGWFQFRECGGDLGRDLHGLACGAGITYRRLDEAGIQWPVLRKTIPVPASCRRHLRSRGAATLRRIRYSPTSDTYQRRLSIFTVDRPRPLPVQCRHDDFAVSTAAAPLGPSAAH